MVHRKFKVCLNYGSLVKRVLLGNNGQKNIFIEYYACIGSNLVS